MSPSRAIITLYRFAIIKLKFHDQFHLIDSETVRMCNFRCVSNRNVCTLIKLHKDIKTKTKQEKNSIVLENRTKQEKNCHDFWIFLYSVWFYWTQNHFILAYGFWKIFHSGYGQLIHMIQFKHISSLQRAPQINHWVSPTVVNPLK